MSSAMSTDDAEWVSAPTEMKSTPVSAISRTVSRVTPPLASILVRLDLCEDYEELLERVFELGTPAFTALHNVFEQIPERDTKRREILKQARILWSRLLARARAQARARR